MTRPPASARVAIAAAGLLARAGLRRIVAEAGLDVVDSNRRPDIVLYDEVHFVPSSRQPAMQIAFQADRIVIAVATTPTEALWSDVRKLLHCLDGLSGSISGQKADATPWPRPPHKASRGGVRP